MRLVWLAAISVLAVVMAVLTPYVFRTESTWQAAAPTAGSAAAWPATTKPSRPALKP
ncbi:hypothetical protein ACWEOA_17045 [Streptomyces sp. NPDC004457]